MSLFFKLAGIAAAHGQSLSQCRCRSAVPRSRTAIIYNCDMWVGTPCWRVGQYWAVQLLVALWSAAADMAAGHFKLCSD